jgi:hypothetical protein
MALAFTNLGGMQLGVDQTSYSASITTVPATLHFCYIEGARDGSTNPPIPTVTHEGITATQIASLLWITTGATRRTIWLFAWNSGAGGGPSTILADFGVLMSGCSFRAIQVDGSDVANGVAQCFVQSVATAADLSGTSGSITLAAAANANNRPFGFFCHQANEESTVTAPWLTTSPNSAHANPLSGMKGEHRDDAFGTAVTMSWTTSAPYGGLATEIKAASGGAAALDPFGMAGFYGG